MGYETELVGAVVMCRIESPEESVSQKPVFVVLVLGDADRAEPIWFLEHVV